MSTRCKCSCDSCCWYESARWLHRYVSIRITFDDGTITTWKALGNKFKKGTTRTFEISFEYSGGAIEDVELLSSGKDGIKCTDVQVEISGKPPVSFSMPSFLKCRGSKRAGTWNCGMKLKRKVTEDDSTGCKTCDKESQKKISDFSGASLSSIIVDRALDLDDERYKQLVYGFGKLIMDCSINAAVRFEYDAFATMDVMIAMVRSLDLLILLSWRCRGSPAI